MKYAAKKLSALIITLFMVSVLAFLAFQIIPGDPTTKMLGTEATPEAVRELPCPAWVWIVPGFPAAMGVGWPLPVRRHGHQLQLSNACGRHDRTKAAGYGPADRPVLCVHGAAVHTPGSPGGQPCVIGFWTAPCRRISSHEYPPFSGILMCYVFGILFRLFVPGVCRSGSRSLGMYPVPGVSRPWPLPFPGRP